MDGKIPDSPTPLFKNRTLQDPEPGRSAQKRELSKSNSAGALIF